MDEAVTYELEMSIPEANMFSINPDSGEISTKSNFDANLLSDAKLITLNLKVQNKLKKPLMPCPFTSPKMFCAGPNFLSQPENLTTLPLQKLLCRHKKQSY